MITVEDICNDKENDPSEIILIEGKNPDDRFDPTGEEYYYGAIKDVPDELKQYTVRRTAWAIGRQCHVIIIDWIRS